MRSGVHQALDFGEGREWGVLSSIIAVSAERAEENHWTSWLGEGVSGGGGISQFLGLSVSPGQSASCQQGLGLSLWGEKGAYGDQDGGVVGPCRGERRRITGAKSSDHMSVGESQIDGAGSMGSSEGEPSINAWGVEESKA